MSQPPFCYELFGLRLSTEMPLPELSPASAGGEPDVWIHRGPIPSRENEKPGLSVFPEGALLRIDGVGRYWMAAGRELVVEADPAASERNVRLYLLGSAIAAILHQRALLPLHANAVVVDGRAIAFMGHPGAGKSTLAAWFYDHGFEVLADDVCVVTADEDEQPLANPGIPRLRLWREALDASGRAAEDYERSFDDLDKYTVPTLREGVQRAVPLSHVYLLEKRQEPGPPVIRLQGSAAVEALVSNTYRGAYLPMMGGTQQHLLSCARLATKVPVFRARRSWGFEVFDAEGAALEEHARALIAERQKRASS